jgi:Uma2 family endonuclease
MGSEPGTWEIDVPLSEAAYHKLALEDPDGQWELHHGKARRKPDMSWEHNYEMSELFGTLYQQLDHDAFQVRANMGRVRRSSQNYYIPDVYVVPAEIVRAHRGERGLEFYEGPVPLVVEIWSPSTGDYDVEEKLVEYQRRGDAEIWLIHPYDHNLRAWVRQADGTYTESTYTGGVISPTALPGVSINLDELFS